MRLFVAVVPPPPVSSVLASLPRPARNDVRWTPSENLHATLRFLGDADEAAVTAALGAATLPRTTAVVGPAVVELRRGLAVAPVDGLQDLAAAVAAATGHLGEPPPDRPFRGHVTLARVRRGGPTPLVGVAVEQRFTVDEVVLVASETHPTGAVHTVRRRWSTG